MAISPRPVTSSVPASTLSVRPSAASRANVATDGSPVEEASAQANVSFDTAMLFQNNEQTGERNEDSLPGRTLLEFSGGSQTFATILEDSVLASGGREASQGNRRGYSGYVARAINIYETNAEIIHGSGPDPRGTTLSLSL